MSQFFGDSIFWIEVEKIRPNPYQPRREFDEAKLNDLAESIRMYGVLQPLVVTRRDIQREDGGMSSEYELISGERRLRASKIAGIREVPAIIRRDTDDSRLKLELAIIENLQREDLNAVDRARAFKQLVEEFKFKHSQVAERVGKSREYVTNTLRILELPEELLSALAEGKITEGHTRPLLMLSGRPEEQVTLFKEITLKRLTVREAEHIARNIAVERVRRKDNLNDPTLYDLETKLSEALGTRVRVERKEKGGRVHIDFFTESDLRDLLERLNKERKTITPASVGASVPAAPSAPAATNASSVPVAAANSLQNASYPFGSPGTDEPAASVPPAEPLVDDRTKDEVDENDDDLYSVRNFSV